MKILRNSILAIYFLLTYFPSVLFGTQYISLGRDCQVSGQLIAFKLRNAAYPLEWMVSYDFYGIMQAFRDDFHYFLDPAVLEYQTTYIENIYYRFGFNHFFPLIGQSLQGEDVCVAGTIIPNYLDYLPMVQEIQGRRITRLINLLSSEEKVVFIRTHAVPSEAKDFVELIKEKYPKLDFLLVVVHGKKELIGDWNIPHVLNFYASQRIEFADWWTHEEWARIFDTIYFWLNLKHL